MKECAFDFPPLSTDLYLSMLPAFWEQQVVFNDSPPSLSRLAYNFFDVEHVSARSGFSIARSTI